MRNLFVGLVVGAAALAALPSPVFAQNRKSNSWERFLNEGAVADAGLKATAYEEWKTHPTVPGLSQAFADATLTGTVKLFGQKMQAARCEVTTAGNHVGGSSKVQVKVYVAGFTVFESQHANLLTMTAQYDRDLFKASQQLVIAGWPVVVGGSVGLHFNASATLRAAGYPNPFTELATSPGSDGGINASAQARVYGGVGFSWAYIGIRATMRFFSHNLNASLRAQGGISGTATYVLEGIRFHIKAGLYIDVTFPGAPEVIPLQETKRWKRKITLGEITIIDKTYGQVVYPLIQ